VRGLTRKFGAQAVCEHVLVFHECAALDGLRSFTRSVLCSGEGILSMSGVDFRLACTEKELRISLLGAASVCV